MVYSYPYVPIGGAIRIGIAIFSYCGRLFYGLTGDYDTVTDIDVLRDGIEDGMRQLLDAAAEAHTTTVKPHRASGNGASSNGTRAGVTERQAASGSAAGKRRRATGGARKGRQRHSG